MRSARAGSSSPALPPRHRDPGPRSTAADAQGRQHQLRQDRCEPVPRQCKILDVAQEEIQRRWLCARTRGCVVDTLRGLAGDCRGPSDVLHGRWPVSDGGAPSSGCDAVAGRPLLRGVPRFSTRGARSFIVRSRGAVTGGHRRFPACAAALLLGGTDGVRRRGIATRRETSPVLGFSRLVADLEVCLPGAPAPRRIARRAASRTVPSRRS